MVVNVVVSTLPLHVITVISRAISIHLYYYIFSLLSEHFVQLPRNKGLLDGHFLHKGRP